MDQLARTRLLEYQFNGGANWDLARRGARKVGQEVDARVLVQGNYGKVDRLRIAETPDARVADNEEHIYVSFAFHFFPLEIIWRGALAASLGWRVVQPLAGGTVLQKQPTLVTGVPKGLGQIVWNRGRSVKSWNS